MRAVRVECAIPSIEHDPRARAALQAVSWDYRGVLDQVDGNLRVMCECITTDAGCPSPGFSVGGITVVEIIEEWSTDYLTHHLVILDFDSDFLGRFFHSRDLTLLAGSNITSSGLIIQVAGRQASLVSFLNALRRAIPVDRITKAKDSEGILLTGRVGTRSQRRFQSGGSPPSWVCPSRLWPSSWSRPRARSSAASSRSRADHANESSVVCRLLFTNQLLRRSSGAETLGAT